jgi:protein subunit release factor A
MAHLTLFEKLDHIESRYEEMTQQLSSPEILSDSGRYQKLAKQHAEMAQMVAKYKEWKEIEKGLQDAKQLLVETDDPEMKQMAHDEEHALEARHETVERELKLLLIPKDPNDEKNVIVEIRAGTGGDEASLFAGELFRMYSRYAETQGWRVEILESSPSSIDPGEERLFEAEVREWRASRAARSGHRAAGPHSHLRRDGGRAAGSRRDRYQDRAERLAHRYVLLIRTRRPVGEHDLLGGAHYTYSNQHRC